MTFNSQDSARLIKQLKKSKCALTIAFRDSNEVEISFHQDEKLDITYNEIALRAAHVMMAFLQKNDPNFSV